MEMVDGSMIWLLVSFDSGDFRQLKEKVFDLKRRNDRVKVFFTDKEKMNAFDVLVFKDMAKEFLEKGLDGSKEIKFAIHKRNF